MDIMHVVKQGQMFLGENSSAILTAIGVTGTVTTAVLTGKATVKAVRVVDLEVAKNIVEDDDGSFIAAPQPRPFDVVKMVWPLYIPPVGVGAATVTSIIMANRISSKKAAAMAAAYGLSENRLKEYREKVTEKLGVNKERAARDELAQDRVNKTPGSEIIMTSDGEVLCLDQFTGRFFKSTKEDIKRAENLVNDQIIKHIYCGLNEFYGEIGLEPTSMSDELGWNMHTTGIVEIQFSSALTPDGRPCLAIDFANTPQTDYVRGH